MPGRQFAFVNLKIESKVGPAICFQVLASHPFVVCFLASHPIRSRVPYRFTFTFASPIECFRLALANEVVWSLVYCGLRLQHPIQLLHPIPPCDHLSPAIFLPWTPQQGVIVIIEAVLLGVWTLRAKKGTYKSITCVSTVTLTAQSTRIACYQQLC